MADMNITQAEADALIAMPKIRVSDAPWKYPSLGGVISIPLISPDKRENFLLDIRKGRINLSKGSYQNRSRQVIVLVRIDFGGSVHRNPDGAEVHCPHLHLYREGYGHKWGNAASGWIIFRPGGCHESARRLYALLQHHRTADHSKGVVLMINEINTLLDQYSKWLRDKTSLRQLGDWIEISTPYLDRHNDTLQIYAKRHNGGYLLTDDGYIIEDLQQSGCKLDTGKRQALLNMTLNGFGVRLKDGHLEIQASTDNFAVRKHNLVQAMLAVNDLFNLAVPIVASLFFEDVVAWLDLHEIRYTPKVKFTGRSGYDHVFDFVIPKSRTSPERILQAINRPSRDTAEALAWAWLETREVRPPESKAYAFLNDSDHTISALVPDALRTYDVNPILWSRREEARMDLAA